MKDYLVRAMTTTGHIRAFTCVTSGLVREICERHETSPTATAALARALTGGALMSALLQDGQRIALKFEGNGPLRKILVEADSAGHVRGYVAVPQLDLPLRQGNFDVAAALGKAGFLTVTKDLRLKEPYKGVVQLHSSEIAEDLAYYFAESEQIPSATGTGVFIESSGRVASAGGFLIQSLPPADELQIEALIGQIEKLPPLAELLQQGLDPEGLLTEIFRDIPFTLLGTMPLSSQCHCSEQRMKKALSALGPDELNKMSLEADASEIICEFCRAHYVFGPEDIHALVESIC
ncbi:Hsp33 family molecular chaperone HslO [candidate division KSB3 bacterium]|uniref:33 kDa chaperonin n=1 Tax=candidate division KSB3 bacterium TaxID=2044937 RepID=A0A2G6E5L9_9BACT|nr:MAG: Hsp33 family molecular chaperone HslO [candidate division KSB3 bacterium]PIE29883.1 MAG: Hsp33 family molecular chaperone HslO [candidate division KSB3 bacterium]